MTGEAPVPFTLIRAGPVSERKAYPLRLGSDVMTAMQRWADEDLRSLNAQIEYVLREALRGSRRLGKSTESSDRSMPDKDS